MIKKLTLILCLITLANFAWAEGFYGTTKTEQEKPKIWCPTTLISDNDRCMNCHVMDVRDGKPFFGLKEVKEYNNLELPRYTSIIKENDVPKLYYVLTGIDADDVNDVLVYADNHKDIIKGIIIEIQSPGGSVFAAWRIKGLMDKYKDRFVIETRCYGMALSAGLILYLNGNIGYRTASPTAEFMAHELWTFKMFDLATPSSKQDEADVLNHLQGTINHWAASRSTKGLTVDELSKKCKRLEFWLNGQQAYDEIGWVDNLVMEKPSNNSGR